MNSRHNRAGDLSMKIPMTRTYRVGMILVGFVTLSACTPTCNCASSVDCSGDINDVIRVCEFGHTCELGDKGEEGLCVEAFPDDQDDTTTF